MCRKFLWCYVFVLILLDLSLNSKLTALGKSHDVTIQDSFREGMPFQEWDKEVWGESVGNMETEDEGEPIEGVSLDPPVLKFGQSALATPHARSVTITNTANTTIHLASVAGTTPDFHASFFESKTLAPQGNTTFTVVYLGRREGPVSARLYIHTSLGIQKYTVSAVGVASEYDVWPLVGVRVPLNATVEWELRLHNPTATTIQVTEVYSSGAWLSLALPSGGERGARALWSVPPRTTRALVRLRAAPAPAAQPLTAYVRVRGVPGGDLLLPVTARAAPPGEYARPLQVRQRPSGTGDPPYTVEIEMANSGAATITMEGGVRGACRAVPAPDPCQQQPRRANGASASGAQLTMLRTQLEPDQEFTPVARLTLDYGALWAQATGSGEAGEAEGAWCAGCVRLGDALVPYSVRVLPGALVITPPQLLFVTSMGAEARRARIVTALNEFRVPLRVHALTVPSELTKHFKIVDHTPLTIEAGASVTILELQLLGEPGPELAFDEQFALHTDLSHYLIPLRLYSGNLTFEWEWGQRGGETVQLGTLGTSTTRRVGVRVRNPAPLVMCVTRVAVTLPGAALALPGPLPHCIEGGGGAQAWLTVVAPAREGELRGEVALHTEHARSAVQLALRVRNGRLRVAPLRLPPSAPYTRSTAELVVNNTMSVSMKVTEVRQPDPDPAVVYDPLKDEVDADGLHTIGRVSYEPERACHPNCYTGLNLDEPEGVEWARRASSYDDAALQADLALLRARLAAHAHVAALPPVNVTLLLHTDEVVQTRVSGTVRARWPRLAAAGAGDAGRGALRTSLPLRVSLYNPARVPLLLHARLAQPLTDLPDLARSDTSFCMSEKCTWLKEAFNLTGWRVTKGGARVWRGEAGPETVEGAAERPDELPPLLLAPLAEVELALLFTPLTQHPLTAQLLLRNNLTVLEAVDLYGHGEYPSFDLAGRRPGAASPFLFEVKDCAWGEGGAVERTLTLRNTGRVGVQLTRWAVGGARGACSGRGFLVRPCAPLVVPPAAAADLHVTFVPDYTLARVTAPLRAFTPLGPVEYSLRATIPVRVLAECAATAPRPPWENAVRTLGVAVALAALALVLAAGALDAERLLRRARAARSPEQPSVPLDLRALRPPAPLPAQKAPTRRRRAARKPPPPDPAASAAERRAFERWRSEVLRREDDTSRSSEDDAPATPPVPPDPRPPTPSPALPQQNGDDAATSGSDVSNISNLSSTSTPVEEQEADECYGGDVEPSPRDLSPATPPGPLGTTPEPEVIPDVLRVDPPKATRVSRARRDPGDTTRRERRPDNERRVLVRPHARKERPRRRERAPSPPAPPVEEDTCEAPEEVTEAKGNVRWGASWSSVVAGAPLAPIGSDVRRREADRADQSLFYFNGERRADAVAWQPPPAPEPPRPPYIPGARDFMECGGVAGGWWGGAGGGWSAWGAPPPLRPPPGFASPPPPRPFDPFRSLASIWAPAPHDWRVADDPPRTPPARRSPADDPLARNGNDQTH